MFYRRMAAVTAVVAMVAAACSSTATSAPVASGAPAGSGASAAGCIVGVSWNNYQEERWAKWDEPAIKKALADAGATYISTDAKSSAATQATDIENLISQKAKVLIILAQDGTAIKSSVATATAANIPVIAYDRLILGTPNVDYYATFDNFKVGVLQAQYIVDKLGLADGKGPFNIELFAGSPDDNNAGFFFNGAMSILQPYITSGKLVVQSKQTDFQKVATLRWDGAVAQRRMDDILSRYYTSKNVDAVLSPYDGLSRGIIASFQSAGKKLPIITGQDAEVESVKFIIKGIQTQTVYKDTRLLAKQTVLMTTAMLKGTTVPVNDTKQYNNGIKVVPTFLLQPVSVDKSNYEAVLVGGGYYKDSDLK